MYVGRVAGADEERGAHRVGALHRRLLRALADLHRGQTVDEDADDVEEVVHALLLIGGKALRLVHVLDGEDVLDGDGELRAESGDMGGVRVRGV